MTEYEYRDLQFARGISRSAVVQQLTEYAEYGKWELARVRLAPSGERRVRLRRRLMRVARTA
jgi:Family of unknown function (DUF5703)